MKSLPWLFSLTLFVSALLSFSVQPIFGKMLLPMVGGAPASWIVAMAFFQVALLAGYGISYGLGRFSPWVHAAGLLVLYIAGAMFLPPHLPSISATAQGEQLSFAVFRALATTILMPFLALTATTAALQRVFSATRHPTAKDPYYLFVASNIGSFVGLFAYPLVLEPYFGLHVQASSWQIIYGLAMVLILTSCVFSWFYRSTAVPVTERASPAAPVTAKQMAYWLMLSFLPCSLSMGVTSLITNDIGGLPLFWVIPLGLYLLTFILAFAKQPFFSLQRLETYHLIGVVAVIAMVAMGAGGSPAGAMIIFLLLATLLLAVFFFIALHCHQRLAASRPPVSQLTFYYLVIAMGGGLAGLMHAFVLPFILPYSIEFSIAVVLSVLLVRDNFKASPGALRLQKYRRWFYPLVGCTLLALILATLLKIDRAPGLYFKPFAALFIFGVLLLSMRPRWLCLLGIAALFASTFTYYYPGTVLVKERNFFGAMAVLENKGSHSTMRVFVHGNTLHGVELVKTDDPGRKLDFSYYTRGNPIGDILALAKGKDLAVIGLGAGQMACYDPSFTTDFYEIDPDVERIARQYFTYLATCPPRAVVIGDGRLKMAQSARTYNVIVQDAFNSDGIPLHLLTVEALQMYRDHLNPHGLLLYHVSNRYIELAPPLAAMARVGHLQAYQKVHVPKADESNEYTTKSSWVAVQLSDDEGAMLEKTGWSKIVTDVAPWTDDRSSLIEAVRRPQFNLW